MGLPVSKQWLYDRHKVPAPGPDEDLYEPLPPYLSDRRRVAEDRSIGGMLSPASAASAKHSCSCHGLVEAASDEARQRGDGKPSAVYPEGVTDAGAPRAQKEQSTAFGCCIEAPSESTESLNKRKAQAQTNFAQLLKATELKTNDLVWTSGDCPAFGPLNGTTYPDGWTTPPPLHHNCDCEIHVLPLRRALKKQDPEANQSRLQRRDRA